MSRPRPPPPVVERDGFQLRRGRFSCVKGDVGRVRGSRLKELFDPSSLQLEQDRTKAERTAQQLFNKAFFAGQLCHYDIKCPRKHKNMNTGQLRELLREAVFNGECDQVPERVINLKQAMELEMEDMNQQWAIDVQEWEAAKQEALNKKSPGEKANMDINWFMDYYFLTDGKPDRRKTPEPLALYGYSDIGRNICAVVDKVPSLAWAKGGTKFKTTICIGWDYKAVQTLASKVTAEAWDAKREQEQLNWQDAMEDHHWYLATRTGTERPQTSFDLGQCRGSYAVKSDTLSRAWEEFNEECFSAAPRPPFTLDIRDSKVTGILLAAVKFATFTGAMILSDSKRKLRNFLRARHESDGYSDFDYDGEEGSGYEEDEEDDESDEIDDDGDHEEDDDRVETDHDDDDEDWESVPPRKRQKITQPASRRVFFRIRGWESGEYYSDPSPGYLDFSNDGYASFCGQCDLPTESKVDLKGYKVSEWPSPTKRGGDFEWSVPGTYGGRY
ncbi:hypothetical protein FDECE_3943 [Fusarium decemcellulare]|nr:hypothetical protein FDECE_3943 [Fusarium decemcellulare]